jgi:type II secretory pathway component GspD/PulD (secretin)
MSKSADSFAVASPLATAIRGGLLGGLLGLALVQLACTKKVAPTEFGARIVSSTPERDKAAFNESEKQLLPVQWSVIEKRGPKPAWEQLGLGKENYAGGNPAQPGQPTTQPVGREPDPQVVINQVVNITPATQPTTQPLITVIQTLVSEAGLPIQTVDLPDGKVKVIWTLRNYGGASVTSARDPATSRRTVTLAPADLLPLVTVLQQQVAPAGSVVPLPRENTIVVTCDRAQKPAIVAMLANLDVPQRQVQISARIFEVSRDFDFQQGAQVVAKRIRPDNSQEVISTFNSQRALDSAATGAPFQGSVVTLFKAFEEQGISMEASFQILADAGMVKEVSSPRMTVAAGQTGYMLAGQELPIQTATLTNGILTTATQYKPVGVQLYITPQAVGRNRVKLHTISIVSSVAGFAPLPTLTGGTKLSGMINPVIESREAETAVTIEDGSTLVISGLQMVRTTTREEKVPVLGDIPVLGWLFKNHRSQQQLTDLYFFVTPSLL